jgi:ubiquinone/menaquinone biosynthesis C-methylase UbiE
MSKNGEIGYLKKLGEEGVKHALNKPFSDEYRGRYLEDIGTIFKLLPQPPAKILDLGCGTGWTSCLFAKAGYKVVGQDIAPDMIDNANLNKNREGLSNIDFMVSDYENMAYDSEFDGAVFYDSLHHAIDEELALRQVFKALKPGGICVLIEAPKNHHSSCQSLEAVKKFDVTEKEMYPKKVAAISEKVGFQSYVTIPRLSVFEFAPRNNTKRKSLIIKFLTVLFGKSFADFVRLTFLLIKKNSNGIIILKK